MLNGITNSHQITDRTSLLGLSIAFGLVFAAIASGGSFIEFFDIRSLAIVLGGTLGASLVMVPISDFKNAWKLLKGSVRYEALHPELVVDQITFLAKRARKSGILSIQNAALQESNPFLRKCIELAVDGIEPDDIRRAMDIELQIIEDRTRHGAHVFNCMGNIAPAMGLIGTLIGLVQMLQHLEDPSHIGPGMALALLTTLYGALLANIICIPLAGKLKRLSEDEIHIKKMCLEGVIDIAQGTNPVILRQKLLGFIPHHSRTTGYA